MLSSVYAQLYKWIHSPIFILLYNSNVSDHNELYCSSLKIVIIIHFDSSWCKDLQQFLYSSVLKDVTEVNYCSNKAYTICILGWWESG